MPPLTTGRTLDSIASDSQALKPLFDRAFQIRFSHHPSTKRSKQFIGGALACHLDGLRRVVGITVAVETHLHRSDEHSDRAAHVNHVRFQGGLGTYLVCDVTFHFDHE